MTDSPHILLVEDDDGISQLIGQFLRSHARQFRVSAARNGTEMAELLTTSRIDLIVLDLMLPGDDGLTLCRRIRAQANTPIIILTAKSDDYDRIIGLEMGADDYLTKPFNPRELLARIKAVLRRSAPTAAFATARRAHVMTFEGWRLDGKLRTLTDPSGTLIAITGAELELLRALCERPGVVLSRDQLLDLTQGRSAGAFERSVDILISRLRRKIERNPHEPIMIKTIRSTGYVFTPAVETA